MRTMLSIAVVLAACTPGDPAVSPDASSGVDSSMADAGVDAVPVDGATAFPSACAIPTGALHAWTLELPLNANFKIQSDVLYKTDRRSQLLSTTYTRVAYCMQLDATFMYVEFDDFTKGQVVDTGIPTESTFETSVTKLTIRTNASGIGNATNVTGGAIELWPNCYGQGVDGVYDADDTITSSGTDCYGSFQVHRGSTTLFAYNQWAQGSDNDDLGIGMQPQGNPDWTFASNSADYTTRRLQAFVIP